MAGRPATPAGAGVLLTKECTFCTLLGCAHLNINRLTHEDYDRKRERERERGRGRGRGRRRGRGRGRGVCVCVCVCVRVLGNGMVILVWDLD